MESNTNAGQPSQSDSVPPEMRSALCCADGHHHHVHATLHHVGHHSLAAAATVGQLTASSAVPPHSVARTGSSGAKNSGAKNRKRKRTSRACVYCQKLHLSCDEQRPCIRCVKAGRADQCKDGKRKRRGRKRKSMPAEDEIMEEDIEVDIDTVGNGACCSHSDEEDDFGEEVSSSSATAAVSVHSPRHDDDSVDVIYQDFLVSSPTSKRRAVGSGAEPSTNWRSANELLADNDTECEIANMLLSLQSRAPAAIKVSS